MEFVSLPEFAKQHAALSRDEFLASVVDPYLLLPILPEDDDSVNVTSTTRQISHWDRLRHKHRGEWLLPVSKRDGANAFGMMTTLGRAPATGHMGRHRSPAATGRPADPGRAQ